MGRTAIIGGVLFPASIAILAVASGPLSSRMVLLVVSEFFSGLGVMLYDVNLNSVMATVIPDHLRSRVSGAFTAVNYGIRPLGALTGGLLATLVGLRPTLWFAAVGGSLAVLWLRGSGVPGARTLDDLAPAAPGQPEPDPGLPSPRPGPTVRMSRVDPAYVPGRPCVRPGSAFQVRGRSSSA